MQQGLLRGAADFPGQAGEYGHPAAILADFHRGSGSEVAKGGFKLCSEFHTGDYK
jgi:hypothetical protein